MFLDKFEVGKHYRFNKELLSKHRKLNGWKIEITWTETTWEDEIHLQEVIILGNRDAKVGSYLISPEWCEEITEGDGR